MFMYYSTIPKQTNVFLVESSKPRDLHSLLTLSDTGFFGLQIHGGRGRELLLPHFNFCFRVAVMFKRKQ